MLPQIVALDDLSEHARARVRDIYEEAFPARQRVPFDELVQAARSGDELALVGLERGRPMGFAFLSSLEAAGHLFLEYFAIASDLRGGGRGRALMQAVRDEPGGAEGARPIVLEVEDPQEHGIDAEEADMRVRRVRFWEHAGAVLLAVEGYVIPDIGGTGTEPMRLMWMAARPDDGPPQGARLLELILSIYESGYGLEPDDGLVRRALRVWG